MGQPGEQLVGLGGRDGGRGAQIGNGLAGRHTDGSASIGGQLLLGLEDRVRNSVRFGHVQQEGTQAGEREQQHDQGDRR
ncbi:MAG: hypothetical protein JOZ47_02360 [Kutzneria sp.]|nr:hypothetical protein [Kutzneria sp.]MBV9843904.1 hypothetical protein [Kutzneria sp.]